MAEAAVPKAEKADVEFVAGDQQIDKVVIEAEKIAETAVEVDEKVYSGDQQTIEVIQETKKITETAVGELKRTQTTGTGRLSRRS
ncbi:hypothetical protein TNCT_632151 [Trichonephila clavata]|uniref:Uncharacterized protein n=1 Tax=Trichonephila clavata TaxID=2740835 RepID=A0A8X6H3J2_TRICU|nr:hypothetical protein TNCT_632151 [Trichonephila clavata]